MPSHLTFAFLFFLLHYKLITVTGSITFSVFIRTEYLRLKNKCFSVQLFSQLISWPENDNSVHKSLTLLGFFFWPNRRRKPSWNFIFHQNLSTEWKSSYFLLIGLTLAKNGTKTLHLRYNFSKMYFHQNKFFHSRMEFDKTSRTFLLSLPSLNHLTSSGVTSSELY